MFTISHCTLHVRNNADHCFRKANITFNDNEITAIENDIFHKSMQATTRHGSLVSASSHLRFTAHENTSKICSISRIHMRKSDDMLYI